MRHACVVLLAGLAVVTAACGDDDGAPVLPADTVAPRVAALTPTPLAQDVSRDETITGAYLLLIHVRQGQSPGSGSFAAFAARNPDLLTWRPSVLARYYREETLGSDRARRTFLLPDRLESPG